MRFNTPLIVFDGSNGSGKTSHLEALYALSTGRSFRSNRHTTLISHGESNFVLFAKGQFGTLALSRGVDKDSADKALINGVPAKSASELSQSLPTMLINADTFRLLEDGPDIRRQFFDWGVFHVEHHFVNELKDYKRALKQRNNLLRKGYHEGLRSTEQAIRKVMIEKGESVMRSRVLFYEAFIDSLKPLLDEAVDIFGLPKLKLRLKQGWPKSTNSFSEALDSSFQRDIDRGATTVGPHRFDLQIELEQGGDAKDYLSRGQTKRLAIMLKLAQLDLLAKQRSESSVVVLADDLPAELDKDQLAWSVEALNQRADQLFITTVDARSVLECVPEIAKKAQVFHVEH